MIASNNPKKRAEITAILEKHGIIVMPTDKTIFVDVDEDGHTFARNARKKAEAFSAANRCAALGDDSGLCVEALHGAPGVYSSRFAGLEACQPYDESTAPACAGEPHADRRREERPKIPGSLVAWTPPSASKSEHFSPVSPPDRYNPHKSGRLPDADDAANNARLLQELKGVANRKAYF
ncbi:MAG: non-canonical purine NTP pyrophosphatase, partial [Mariprofundaceae bacterium]|nr:non-canonical purine NTP pyrophosphatase [Mariprofundaceae bacterium]